MRSNKFSVDAAIMRKKVFGDRGVRGSLEAIMSMAAYHLEMIKLLDSALYCFTDQACIFQGSYR